MAPPAIRSTGPRPRRRPGTGPQAGRHAAFLCAGLLFLVEPSCQVPEPPSPPVAAAPAATSLRERAVLAEAQGRFGEAADLFLQLVDQDPQRVDWVVAAGRCLGRSGRFQAALDFLDGKRKQFPDVPDVAAMLARTQLLRAETDRGALLPEVLLHDAVATAEAILAQSPDHEDARLILAQARYRLGDVDAATAQAQETARRHPKRAGAHVLLGRIAFDRFAALQRTFDATKPTAEEGADLVAAIGLQRDTARREFRRAAELDPTRAHPHQMLGDLAALDREPADALRHFADALAIDPAAPLDHGFVAKQLACEPRAAWYREIQARYAQAAPADAAKAASLQWHAGLALYEGGQWAAARATFASTRTANPAFTNVFYYEAMCAFRLEDHDAAAELFSQYARVSAPAFADVMRGLPAEHRGEVAAIVKYLADRAFQQKRLDQSRDLNHAIACFRDSADAWNNYAFLCRETGRFEESLAAYENALEKERDSPQLLNDAAVILQYHLPGAANLERAKAMYDRAIELAKKAAADPSVDAAAKQRAAQALADAQQNLAKLPR